MSEGTAAIEVAVAPENSPAPAPSDTCSPKAVELPSAVVNIVSSDAASTEGGDCGDDAAKKRAASQVEGCGDDKRRRLDIDFSIGDVGVFYTTMSPGKAHDARRDLVRLLESVLPDDFVGSSLPSAASTRAVGSSSAKCDAELRQSRERKERFITCGQGVAKGTGFVKFAGSAVSLVPSEVIVRVLEAQKAEYQANSVAPSSRLLCRVLPVDHTCKPFIEDFQKLAKEVLQPHLSESAPPTVWALEFRARNTTTLKKEAVLSVIDDLVSKDRHKVNLNDPEKCILVEVNPLFCGVSVLPQWAELKKYNLHALTSPEDSPKATTATAQISQSPEPSPRSAESKAEQTSSMLEQAAAPIGDPVVASEIAAVGKTNATIES